MKRVALAVLFASSAGSFAANLGTGAAWGFVGAALLSIFWRRSGPAPRLLGLGKRLLHLTLVLMGILGWILVTYPIVSTSALHFSSLVLGYGFGAFGIFFLLRDGLPPREGAIPAAIGLMTVSSFDVLAKVQPYLLAAAAAGFLYLASEVLGAGTPRRRARAMVLAAFAILSIAAARGIVLVLPWAQGKIEVAMMAAYVPEAGDGEGNRRLGDLRSLKLSKKVVMRVYSERPQKLRSGVLVRFDGASWHADPSTMRTLAPTSEVELSGRELAFLRSIPGSDFLLDPGALLGSRLVHTSVVRVDGSGLPTPGGSRVLHAPLESAHVDSAGIVQPPPRVAVRWYGILHELDHRRSQGALLEGSERESSLQLPPVLDPRIPALAREVIEGAPGDERVVESRT